MFKYVSVIAAKDYRDTVISGRFIFVLAIVMISCLIGINYGLTEYSSEINDYKQHLSYMNDPEWSGQIDAIRQQIATAEALNATAVDIDELKAQLDNLINPVMPSALLIVNGVISSLSLVGMVLAIAIGFNLMSKEIEEGSLKMLLSHPVHRDSIILGKIVGAILLLLTALLIVYAITLAALFLYGIVPGLDDIGRIAVSFIVTLLYFMVFLTIAIATSVLAQKSSISILVALGIAFFALLLPMIISSAMQLELDYSQHGLIADGQTGNVIGNEDYNDILERNEMVSSIISVITPKANIEAIYGNVLLTGSGSKSSDSMAETLSKIQVNVGFLLVEIIAAIAIAFNGFLRTDLPQV